jgi:hypothetical protein
MVPEGYHAFGQGLVVSEHEPHSHHEIVNVVEDEGVLRCILLLPFDESDGVLTPMAQRVEMVRGVIAIVEAMAVTLARGRLASYMFERD